MPGWAACHDGEPPGVSDVLAAADELLDAVFAFETHRSTRNELQMIGRAANYRIVRDEAQRATQT